MYSLREAVDKRHNAVAAILGFGELSDKIYRNRAPAASGHFKWQGDSERFSPTIFAFLANPTAITVSLGFLGIVLQVVRGETIESFCSAEMSGKTVIMRKYQDVVDVPLGYACLFFVKQYTVNEFEVRDQRHDASFLNIFKG